MNRTTLDELANRWNANLGVHAASLGIDPICSRVEWQLPCARSFAPEASDHVYDDGNTMVAFIEHQTRRGPVLTSMDSVWGFSTPIIAADADEGVNAFRETVGSLGMHAVAVSGVRAASALDTALTALGPVATKETTHRCIVDLGDGADSWLQRRSAKFRRSVRVARRQCDAAGVRFDHTNPDPTSIDKTIARIAAIELESWKTDAGSGLIGTPLGSFTADMMRRFAATGNLHVVFAFVDERDVGYVVGATVRDRYRGFQHSFVNDLRSLSIGKSLQWHNLVALAERGVETYDMGMFMGYKQSYADRVESSHTHIFRGRDLR